MHLLDRLLWAAVRILPACSPGWLDGVPQGDHLMIGPGWPVRHAEALGIALAAAPDGGLVADLEALRGPNLDPGAIHPNVRAFYEHTARFSLAVSPRWSPPFRWGSALWSQLYPRRWRQLELPDAGAPLTNEILALGPDGSAGTLWVRRYTGTDRALYVSRYDVVTAAGEPDPCVRIAFPVPGGSWVVLFRVVLAGGSLLLTEADGVAGGPGLYFVPNGGPARYFAWFREEIEVRPTDEGALAEHRFRFAGIPFLTLAYALPLSEATVAASVGTAK